MGVTLYDIVGFISAAAVVLSLAGIVAQLTLIWDRKKLFAQGKLSDGETPTAILSLNRFSGSFIAFFAMFVYAMTLQTMNIYIAAPRAIALVLLLLILFEMQADRKTKRARGAFYGCLFFILISIAFMLTPYRSLLTASGVSQGVIIGACLIFIQGVVHQIYAIRQSGRTGALSLRMYQLFFFKDASAVFFAFLMGFEHGWPVFVMHIISLSAQIVTLYHFLWVRRSPKAASRRAMLGAV